MKKMLVVLLAVFAVACGPGEPGPMGPPGPAGPRGPAGDAGTPGVGLTQSIQCGASTSVGPVRLVYHRIYRFADGSTATQCEVDATDFTTASTLFYVSGQTGAPTGSCRVVSDVDSASFGFWEFTYSGSSSKALYYDPASSWHQYSVTLTCTTV